MYSSCFSFLLLRTYHLPSLLMSLQLTGVSGKFFSTKCSSWGYSRGCAHLEAGLGHPSCLLTSFSMGSLITQWLCPSAWQVDPRGSFPEKKPQCTRADQDLASSPLLLFHWPKQCMWPSPESTQGPVHTRACHSLTPYLLSFLNMFLSHTLVVQMCCVRWVNLELINNMYWILTRGQMPWKVKAEVLATQSCLSLWPYGL